jgi:predicted alpha-1,2-mannosidase
MIGTGGTGHTFPGAVLPFGMVQLSPDTRIDGSWDGCSGYHYSDSKIFGFSHTHLSGTGCSDWGDVMLMPMSEKPSLDKTIYSSSFLHSKEKASAGFYEVFLDDENVKVELTATLRTGIHRYTFPKNKEGNIILDLLHRDKLLSGNIKITDSVTVTGFRISEAWAKEQHCYFAIKFSQPIFKNELKKSKNGNESEGAIFSFKQNANSQLIVKVAISGVSEEGALNNLNSEAIHWDFEKYKSDAQEAWNKQLSKIQVSNEDTEKQKIFYTALYHCCIHPSLNMDADRKYRGRDNKIHVAKDFTNYTVFSLWDTYRALHPLLTIIEPERTEDFIKTFLNQFTQSGRLPVWELSSNETDCMIGYHSVSVIADAMAKGINNFDKKIVYEAAKAASTYTGFGIHTFYNKGFLSAEDEPESVSKTLEYSYDNWCISQIMAALGKTEDFDFYQKSSLGYRNLFNPSSGFFRARKNGNWLSPFDPYEVNNHYTEGNAWQYSCYAPHDIQGLILLHKGAVNFEKHLDALFTANDQTTGRQQVDITGLIGQYAHGNEPSHHIAYLYNYLGKPRKTQERVHQILNDFYKNSPDGLIGNEDCGQMSAWYVFSALGFYPVCPGSDEYTMSKPFFDSARIEIKDTEFLITYEGKKNKPVKGITHNGVPMPTTLKHGIIKQGGELRFKLHEEKDSVFRYGSVPSQRSSSKVNKSYVSAPIINAPLQAFDSVCTVEILQLNTGKFLTVYTLDGSEPKKNSLVYSAPFQVSKSCTVKAKHFGETGESKTSTAVLHKKPNHWKIAITSPYNKQYTAGGDEGIIDGKYGDLNWRKGEWQGYQYKDFECVIDLRKEQTVNSVSINLLQDTRSWIIFPKGIEVYVSKNNKEFTLARKINNVIDAADYTVQIQKLEASNLNLTAQYIKIVARNYGTLPEWHEGKGDGAFIFIDEIEIK